MITEITDHIKNLQPFLMLLDMRTYLAYYPEELRMVKYEKGEIVDHAFFPSIDKLTESCDANAANYDDFRSMAPIDNNENILHENN